MKPTSQQIYVGNQLIANYLGLKPCKVSLFKGIKVMDGYIVDKMEFAIKDLRYHLKWDWIMPVFIKILNENSSSAIIGGFGYIPKHFAVDFQTHEKYGTVADLTEKEKGNEIIAFWIVVVEYLKEK